MILTYLKNTITIFLIANIVISCANVKPIVEEVQIDQMPPEIIKGEASVYLFEDDHSDSTKSSISYQFYNDNNLPYKDSVNCVIKKFIVNNTEFEHDEISNCALSLNYVEQKLSAFKDNYNDAVENDGYDYGVWSVNISIDIRDINDECIEVNSGTWSYTGGAHGNGHMMYDLVDKKTGLLLGLDEFFSDIDELNKIAEPAFRTSQGLTFDEDLSNAGFWFDEGVFHVNENFSFIDGFLTFYYNPYEIAPYASGAIVISIPIDDVKHLLLRKVD